MIELFGLREEAPTPFEVENQNRVRELAGECMVLLENNGILPLKEHQRTIALFGDGARRTIKGGTGSGDVNAREVISVEQGLKEAGFAITSDRYLDRLDQVQDAALQAWYDLIAAESKRLNIRPVMAMYANPFEKPDIPSVTEEDVKTDTTDLAVYVIARNAGEGADRFARPGDYYLSENETASLKVIKAHYKHVIVLLNVGGIIDIPALQQFDFDALVLMGQHGNIGGHVAADVLTGKSIPSGRLTDTWAKRYEDYPSSATFSHNNGNIDDEYYSEGIYVGYRYFDTFGIEPAYCFGYGLNYTTFTREVLGVDADEKKISVHVQVTNSGKTYAGKEVIQVYASSPAENAPFQELKGYDKTKLLAPGESETLIISFETASLAQYVEESATWELPAGDYILRIGSSSRESNVAAIINLPRTAVTQRLKNICPLSENDSHVEPLLELQRPHAVKVPEGVKGPDGAIPRFSLDPEKIACFTPAYSGNRQELTDTHPDDNICFTDVQFGRYTVEELVGQLTVEEMAQFVVGTARLDTVASQIGSSGIHLPGAAAETAVNLRVSRSIPWVSLVDGPAGLRLQPHYKATKDGQVLPGGEKRADFTVPFPDDLPTDAVDYWQWCTAIPVATTLASSWNLNLIRTMGEIVGSEMERYHAHLWLAPGMNIHRNPLCGRNFEYYSEDPLVSGLCAAADTEGVQSGSGRGTCIKHFACNNQEDNRNYNNSVVSERALREIYLKGFEIAVRQSQPLSLMTSYNLVNGEHTSNSYDLCQTVLRDEWGFEGLVMTDWFSSQDTTGRIKNTPVYSWAGSPECVYSGNDLQMPGCQKNVDDIVSAIEAGTLRKADLQFCVCNILRTFVKLFG